MKRYDEKEAHEQFVKGKRLLDSGRYKEAIPIFSELIEISQQILSDKQAKITYETSLNNRGKAKCELGLEKRNKELFEEGLKDYEQSIEGSGKETGSPNLVAQGNLDYGRKQLEDWDQSPRSGFKAI